MPDIVLNDKSGLTLDSCLLCGKVMTPQNANMSEIIQKMIFTCQSTVIKKSPHNGIEILNNYILSIQYCVGSNYIHICTYTLCVYENILPFSFIFNK